MNGDEIMKMYSGNTNFKSKTKSNAEIKRESSISKILEAIKNNPKINITILRIKTKLCYQVVNKLVKHLVSKGLVNKQQAIGRGYRMELIIIKKTPEIR